MLHLAKWHFGAKKFYYGMLYILPKILLYKLNIIPNTIAKEAFLSFFYKDMDYNKFNNICDIYSISVLDYIIRPQIKKQLHLYKSKGCKIIIITASVIEWVKPWAIKNGFDNILASKIEVVNGLLTGKIEGKNCYGVEKVNSFLKEYGSFENYYTIFFGDSKGDHAILKEVNEYYYRKNT